MPGETQTYLSLIRAALSRRGPSKSKFIPAMLCLSQAATAAYKEVSILPNGDAFLQFYGTPGNYYDVQASSDLVTWSVVATEQCASNCYFSFEDTETASYGTRFYRVRPNTSMPTGTGVWNTAFLGSTVNVDKVWPAAVREDQSGSVIVPGSFQGTVDFGAGPLTSAGSTDIFLAKLDSTGSYLWAYRFGGVGADQASSVAVDSSGNFIMVGTFSGSVSFGGTQLSATGARDIFVAKYDTNGTMLWARRFGGTADEQCNGLALGTSNNIFITGAYGYHGTAVTFGGGALPLSGGTSALQYDFFVAKLGADGSYVWAKGYGGQGDDIGYGITVDANGNVLVTGCFEQTVSFGGTNLISHGARDALFGKYSATNGAHLWSQGFGGTGDDVVFGVARDVSTNIGFTGEYQGSATIAGSGLTAPYNPGLPSLFVCEFSSTGAGIWSRGFFPLSPTGQASGRAMAVDSAGNMVVVGYASGSVGFDGTYVGGDTPSALVAKFADSAGSTVWAKGYGSGGTNCATGVATGASNNIYVTGYFAESIDFGPGPLTSVSGQDGFVAKLTP